MKISKFLGKEYEGYKVIDYYCLNTYEEIETRKTHYKRKPAEDRDYRIQHRAYKYILYNAKTKYRLTISGNQLRLIDSGKRTISDMFNSKKGGYKNKQIRKYKQRFFEGGCVSCLILFS